MSLSLIDQLNKRALLRERLRHAIVMTAVSCAVLVASITGIDLAVTFYIAVLATWSLGRALNTAAELRELDVDANHL